MQLPNNTIYIPQISPKRMDIFSAKQIFNILEAHSYMGTAPSKGLPTHSGHTRSHKFLPTTRKTASEYWNDVLREAMNSTKPERFTPIIEQLRIDTDAMLCNQPVSDLCFVLPRAKGQSERGLFAKELVNQYFTSTEDEIGIRIQFNRLLARLSDHHRSIAAREFSEQAQFRQSRGNDFVDVWQQIREDPTRRLGDNVTQPEPQALSTRVTDADMRPLCSSLSGDSPIIPNTYCKTVRTDVMKFPVGAIIPNGRLDLFKQNIGQDLIRQLIQSLSHSSRIHHVQLGNNFISLVGAKAISDYLTNRNPPIQTWYLGGNELDRSCMDLLCHALKDDRHCTALWLKRNPIKPEGAVFLRRLLEENETLELMDFQNTGLLDSGIMTLFEGLTCNKTLRTIYLDANGISMPGAGTIASYFHALTDQGRKGITRLWLSMNRLGDEGCRLLLHALKDYIHIEGLSLGSNGCSAAVAAALYTCLRDSPNLGFLDLGMYKATADMQELTNRLGDEGMPHIAKLIAENRNIQSLSVSCNGVSNNGLRTLLEDGVRNSSSLIHLEYHQYGLKIDDEIKNGIETQLDLNCSKLKMENCYQHVRFLKHSNRVQFIDSIYK